MAGQLRVDEITNEAGTGSPSFPNGVAATTATTAGSITGTTTAAVPTTALGTGTASGTTFLAGDRSWQTIATATPGQLQLLQENILTTSGTWTKATGFDPDDTIMIFLIGGGGSGGAGSGAASQQQLATGGLSGQAHILTSRYGDVSGTWTYTIAAGGAARSGVGVGNNGGQSSFYESNATGRGGKAGGGLGGSRDQNGVNRQIQDAVFLSVLSKNGVVLDDQVNRFSQQSNIGIAPPITDPYSNSSLAPYAFNPCGCGGSAGNKDTSPNNMPLYNTPVPGFLASHGGAGSGTGNGQNATGFGGGGGACAILSGTPVSGAGGSGAVVVRYYRGRVSPLQVIFREA
jgi:hypothetical protein